MSNILFFNDPARASTLLLTSLMVVGLVFFIRASTKDRIEVMQFESRQKADALRQAIIKYFYSRAYRPDEDADRQQDTSSGPTIINGMTLVGMVSPSVFMAVFLSTLAAVGFVCLALVLATLLPQWGGYVFALVLVSPLAGLFYWRKSNRPEKIVFKVEPYSSGADSSVKDAVQDDGPSQAAYSKLTIKGHRDELADLQSAFAEPELKAWAGLKQWECE